MREIKVRVFNKKACVWLTKKQVSIRLFYSGRFRDDDDHSTFEHHLFTGLKDKHGRDIYEGDILAKNGPVRFTAQKEKATYGHGSFGESLRLGYYFDGYYCLPEEDEIVGNVCEKTFYYTNEEENANIEYAYKFCVICGGDKTYVNNFTCADCSTLKTFHSILFPLPEDEVQTVQLKYNRYENPELLTAYQEQPHKSHE